MYASIPRAGSGEMLHEVTLHGVSSLKLACGPVRLRTATVLAENVLDAITPWTRTCTRCPGLTDTVAQAEEDHDGAPCCPDPGCSNHGTGHPTGCDFPGYATNH